MFITLSDEERAKVVDKAAQKVAGQICFNAKDAVKKFKITRADLKPEGGVARTFLDGRTTPVYTVKSIEEYLDKKTELSL